MTSPADGAGSPTDDACFRHRWCLLCPESLLPEPTSYFLSSLGREQVVVWRQPDGRLRAYLNSCPHRGNRLCLYDRGSATQLMCSYHGWTFRSDGRLSAVLFEDRSYQDRLDRDANRLLEVPSVQTHRGLVFGCWDAAVTPLSASLGWLDRWFADLGRTDVGAAPAALPGGQRWRAPEPWRQVVARPPWRSIGVLPPAADPARPDPAVERLVPPNLWLAAAPGGLGPLLAAVCHPCGPRGTQVQLWVLVSPEAPEQVRRDAARLLSRSRPSPPADAVVAA